MPTQSRFQAVNHPQHLPETAAPESAAPIERMLRIDDVCSQAGLSRSTIYSMVNTGAFPAPVRLHGATVAWLQTEVQAWIAARPRVLAGAAPRRRRAAAGMEA